METVETVETAETVETGESGEVGGSWACISDQDRNLYIRCLKESSMILNYYERPASTEKAM